MEDGWALYEVTDNGIGIPEEHYDRIFQVFHRLDPHHQTGEGLGLAIVRRILDRHQGKIQVESKLSTGTTFRIFLPRAIDVEESRKDEF